MPGASELLTAEYPVLNIFDVLHTFARALYARAIWFQLFTLPTTDEYIFCRVEMQQMLFLTVARYRYVCGLR